ncbi:MAG: class I SAM-dependent rRNA methyltransferase [Longimicrobiales bacterium]
MNARAAARWRAGHPWIYRSDIVAAPAVGPGAALVLDERGATLGTALWSPASLISLRLLTPEARRPDDAFFVERLSRAAAYRQRLAPDATAYREVHAEADGLPSLVVDRYGDYLVVQILSAGLEALREPLVEALDQVFSARGILVRNDVPVRRREQLPQATELLSGEVPDRLEVREGPVRFIADPWSGQKTGAFLDQRENRARAASLAHGRALDCFAYHGSFALHLALGAGEVIAVDSSARALERARENAALNGFANLRTREANVFDLLREEERAVEQYDVIVLDPPAFAKTRRTVARALRGYKEINLRALRLLAPGGHLLTFSCSYHVSDALFREMLQAAAADAGRPIRLIEWRGQAPDHPVLLQVPETGYLKGAVLQAVG